MSTASQRTQAHKTPDMISSELSILLRSILIMTGAGGFILGFGLALLKEIPIESALLRGVFLCIVFAIVARWLMMTFFRIHIKQINDARKAEMFKSHEAAMTPK